jgi:copper(I)-binding protein
MAAIRLILADRSSGGAVAALAALLILWHGMLSAFAHDYKVASLQIDHPWTRATPPGAGTAGGYMTIANNGGEADRLTGGVSPLGRVEIHMMEMVDGVMKMRRLPEGLEIAAGETVELKPGGHHLMLVGLKGAIVKGSHVPLTLTFERAGEVDIELAVTPIGTPAEEEMHRHGD